MKRNFSWHSFANWLTGFALFAFLMNGLGLSQTNFTGSHPVFQILLLFVCLVASRPLLDGAIASLEVLRYIFERLGHRWQRPPR